MADKRFIKGLFKDTAHIDQPEGSWRYAKNMIINDKKGSVTNENGNTLAGYLGENAPQINSRIGLQGYKVIGTIPVDNDRIVIFSCEQDTTLSYPRSEIGIWVDDEYRTVLNPISGLWDPSNSEYGINLNFNINNPIEGTFKINSEGDLVVYWTDDLNPPRTFNIDRHDREVLGGVPNHHIYGINPSNSHKNHINLLNLFPHSGPVPHISIGDIWWASPQHQSTVLEGGGLLTAVYYLALAYVDADFVATNFLTVSNPVPIVDEYDHMDPLQKKDGAKEGSQTSKSIVWRVSNVNQDYKYLRPVIIRKMGDATEAFKINDIEIRTVNHPNRWQEIVFSGLEGFTPSSVDEVIIDTVSYETAKTINQLDSVLYLGNLTDSEDLGYQKYANNIKLNALTHNFNRFDEYFATVDNLETGFQFTPVNYYENAVQITDNSQAYRYVPNIYKHKGYMRDEIYAFYIAFILNDGSTSYAYHIPGRKDLGEEKEPVSNLATASFGGLWKEIQSVSPDHGKRFHWIDSTALSISGGAWDATVYRNMNYWENASEFYPDTDDFEIWDENGWTGSNLNGTNVRHHHFPSNRNEDMRTIVDTNCETATSMGTVAPQAPIVGTMRWKYQNHWDPNRTAGTAGRTVLMPNYDGGSGDLNTNTAASVLWDGEHFTANQCMQVEVQARIWLERQCGGSSCAQPSWMEIHTNCAQATQNQSSNVNPVNFAGPWACTPSPPNTPNSDWICDWGGCDTADPWDVDFTQSGSVTYDMLPGERIWILMKGQNASHHVVQAGDVGSVGDGIGTTHLCSCSQCYSWLHFRVTSCGAAIDPADQHDAKISHKVARLGFTLSDIKIPQSIADKVQGFRIYYAKRKHSERTVLGQGPVIPAMPTAAKLGFCKEAEEWLTGGGGGNPGDASQVLGSLQDKWEYFYNMEPWARIWYNYPSAPNVWYTTGNPANPPVLDHDVAHYGVFSFHDFYLLRTKNSISAATHITLEYCAKNLVWNGPTLEQDKKMIQSVVASNGLNALNETWGWDSPSYATAAAPPNCYPQNILSAIMIGHQYLQMSPLSQPRLLGQKAKTYVLGDSIFNAQPLGFGGKLFNEYGESHIAFKLRDDHGINANSFRSYPYAGGTVVGGVTTNGGWFDGDIDPNYGLSFGQYGYNSNGPSSILVNPLDNATHDFLPINGHHRSMNPIINFKAFKTDVYKSIDDQELVWTGFEVVGDDVNNFIFDKTGAPISFDYEDPSGATNTYTADFSVDTLQTTIQRTFGGGTIPAVSGGPEQIGIFGGDTYICRYGFATSLKPSNHLELSNPKKAINYHIVESTDNINFRHQEDDKSHYFPQSIAKDMLRNAGVEDYSFVDNMRYNNNYSELSDIRTAFPLPIRNVDQTDFPTRTLRSTKSDPTSLIDNYRIFLANQYKDLPKNRGDLWKLSAFNNLLYFHMEESLFAAKGKQSMQMKDGSEAFVGSGDIFKQDPDEIIHTQEGFGGTQAQWAALTTRFGYFFVDSNARKIFLMKDKILEISNVGMESWFRDNLRFELEDYGFGNCALDNPIAGFGFHAIYDPKYKRIILTKREFTPTQKFKDNYLLPYNGSNGVVGCSTFIADGRIIFDSNRCAYRRYGALKGGGCGFVDIPFSCFASNYFDCKGWTISYYPELGVWGSFHDYVPYIYFNTSTDFYSLTDTYPRPVWCTPDMIATGIGGCTTAISLNNWVGTTFGNTGIWKHNSESNKGILYQENLKGVFTDAEWLTRVNHYPFEFEFIHNQTKGMTSLFSSFNYTLETFNQSGVSVLEHGFTHYFLYNTFQISGIGNDTIGLDDVLQTDINGTQFTADTLEYFINIRQIGNNWKVNKFRDMAALVNQAGALNVANTSDYYTSNNTNIIGGINTGTVTTSSISNMFTVDGMREIVNGTYIDLSKNWSLRRKFIDKWIGIRLIYDNISNNLLNLYSTEVGTRKIHR